MTLFVCPFFPRVIRPESHWFGDRMATRGRLGDRGDSGTGVFSRLELSGKDTVKIKEAVVE